MRTSVYRIVAGFLAIAFTWTIVVGGYSSLSNYRLVGVLAIDVLFGVFAVFGYEGVERLTCLLLFVPYHGNRTKQD